MIAKGELIDNRYKIVKNIGEGGMANVYLAWDTILERDVAVKILRGDLADDEKFVRRFQREANSASSLRHPNIVEMYDVGEDNGKYFIVMEYVDGRTLKSLIKKRGALNLNESIDIMKQLASGIACAHDSYIIHRDIKPQNVLILEDGRVKITDFGIAMALNNNELTQTNSVMGSVHYLPPEQASGKSSTVKSDIYSLGILMYELLTGKVPFKGENAVDIAIKHMKEPIPSVCKINEAIPQSVENIILRACAKNPKNRYSSMAEMYEDLNTCLNEERFNDARIVYKYPEQDLENTITMPPVETRSSKNTDVNDSIEDEKENKKINTALKILGITAIAIVIIGLLFILIISSKGAKTVKVPEDILGIKEEKACTKIEKAGLVCEVKYDYEEKEKEGIVLEMSPKSLAKVKTGTTVKITVNSYEGTITVKDYVGKKLDLVKAELEKNGIQVIETPQKVTKQDNIEENTILSQSVSKGKKLEKDKGVIELVYATLITVYPDFTDGSYTTTKIGQFCEDNKITCNFEQKEDASKKEGTILEQSREKDEEVKEGSSITITVSVKPATKEPVGKEPEEEVEEEPNEEA